MPLALQVGLFHAVLVQALNTEACWPQKMEPAICSILCPAAQQNSSLSCRRGRTWTSGTTDLHESGWQCAQHASGLQFRTTHITTIKEVDNKSRCINLEVEKRSYSALLSPEAVRYALKRKEPA